MADEVEIEKNSFLNIEREILVKLCMAKIIRLASIHGLLRTSSVNHLESIIERSDL